MSCLIRRREFYNDLWAPLKKNNRRKISDIISIRQKRPLLTKFGGNLIFRIISRHSLYSKFTKCKIKTVIHTDKRCFSVSKNKYTNILLKSKTIVCSSKRSPLIRFLKLEHLSWSQLKTRRRS